MFFFVLVFLHFTIFNKSFVCLSDELDKWPRNGVLRVEVIHDAPDNYSLHDSYRKQYRNYRRRHNNKRQQHRSDDSDPIESAETMNQDQQQQQEEAAVKADTGSSGTPESKASGSDVEHRLEMLRKLVASGKVEARRDIDALLEIERDLEAERDREREAQGMGFTPATHNHSAPVQQHDYPYHHRRNPHNSPYYQPQDNVQDILQVEEISTTSERKDVRSEHSEDQVRPFFIQCKIFYYLYFITFFILFKFSLYCYVSFSYIAMI